MAEIWTMGELLCEVMRPEAGLPLDEPGPFLGPYPSGAPGIFINTAARLGHTAGIVSGVGNDDFGACILRRLESHGVDTRAVQKFDNGSTGVAFVTYFEDGSRRFLFHFSNTPATWARAPEEDIFGEVKFFHLMGCSITASAAFAAEILKLARRLLAKGAKISFDPNIRPELMGGGETAKAIAEVMQNCSVLMPGLAELLSLTGAPDLDTALARSFENPALELVVVKNGARGSLVCTREGKTELGICPVQVKDATGAGDSFDAALLCGLLEGKTPLEAAKMATAAAALNTAAFGPMEGDISPETVRALLEKTGL